MIFIKTLFFLSSIFVGFVYAASKQGGSSDPPHSKESIHESEKRRIEASRQYSGHVHGAINSGIPEVRGAHLHAARTQQPGLQASGDDYAQKTKDNLVHEMKKYFGGSSGSKQ